MEIFENLSQIFLTFSGNIAWIRAKIFGPARGLDQAVKILRALRRDKRLRKYSRFENFAIEKIAGENITAKK